LLTPQEREILAEEILATIIPTPAEWESAWVKECESRIAAVDRGEMAVYDFDDVMAKLRGDFVGRVSVASRPQNGGTRQFDNQSCNIQKERNNE
jgi:hypothetical protein